MIRRREFLGLATATIAAIPVATFAQQSPRRLWVIGFFSTRTKEQDDIDSLNPFRAGLAELGYVEGRDYVILALYANGDATKYPGMASDLVMRTPDVIIATADDALASLQQNT